MSYLAGLDAVIGVGSIDSDGKVSYFSQHNESVFVTAPGENIPVLWLDSTYKYASGTSISAPYVAALAGAAKQIKPDITTDEFKALLMATSDDRGEPGYDEYYGYGAIDCEALITALISDTQVHGFWDISGHWARDSIEYVVEQGFFAGTAQYTFSPNQEMTRAMLVTVLGRVYEKAGGAVESAQSSAFSDVSPTSWYGKYVLWASENGLVDGYGNGRFGPDDFVTREQLVVILNRFSKLSGLDAAGSPDSLDKFADAGSISVWGRDAMAWAVETGLINGVEIKGETCLAPEASATRAQVSAIIERYSAALGEAKT